MAPRNYYVRLAISGTGQETSREINIFEISDWLQVYAEKVAGQKWESWLECLGLSSIKEIKSALKNLRG